MKPIRHWIAALLLAAAVHPARADDFAARCAERAAIERVYHAHRLGTKQAFEDAMPVALIEKLVRQDQAKEAAMRKVYGVEITPAMLAAEVARINSTTRAPEVLAEIKDALGAAERFASGMARPIIVERLLREKFENDDALHAPQRRVAESVRERLLAAKARGVEAQLALGKECKDAAVQERVQWELTARPAEDGAHSSTASRVQGLATPGSASGKAASGSYNIEATAQLAQVLSSPDKAREEKERKFYFEDLPADLQKVLRAQLRQPGDVSAVIETPSAFQIFLAHEHTATALTAAILTIPKRSYEEWLAQQPEP